MFILSARTGFLQEERYVIMTVVSNREVVRLRNAVQSIDPEAFFTVSVVSEVRGRGFSSEKILLPMSEERDVADPAMEYAAERASAQDPAASAPEEGKGEQ